ncbi:MAG TPA: glycosyltransferase family 4 protein [Candidatus Paceibacterota bacterium]|nr:glycosyltransferase family 4 protein [Candidatus Paceibacterota bacterium]
MVKKVLIYSTAYFPMVGGAEVAIKEITDRLPDFNFILVTARLSRAYSKKEKIGNVAVYRLGWGTCFDKLWLAFYGGHFGLKLAKDESFCLVWGVMASFAGLAALRFKELSPRSKFLLTLQEGDDLEEVERKMRVLRWRFKKIFTLADQVQVISRYLREWAQSFGTEEKNITIIPNGVDLDKFNFRGQTKNKTIVTTSRLVKKNGVDTLIRSLTFLPDDYRLKILGVGPDEKKLKNLVRELGLSERVDFVGFVSSENIKDYFAQAEVFARPALSEGLGNSFLEAMAFGLPVLGTPVGGIVDFLKEGETGWLIPPNDPQTLAEKIKFITKEENGAQVEEVTRKARSLVEEKYDWVKIAREMGHLFYK